MLAGSGHIAGVVNPPAANKYQYWTNEAPAGSLAEFVAGAHEHPGSWWPDWLAWLRRQSAALVPASGGRVPGSDGHPALEDAPGRLRHDALRVSNVVAHLTNGALQHQY